MANKRNLTLADGQVATTSTEITAGPSDDGGRMNVFFSNTGTVEEILILTLTRGSDGTARRIKRITLQENEQCEISGLPMNKDDSLKASTTTASVVDYVVSVGPEDSPLRVEVQDADGIRKTMGALNEALFQGSFNEL